MAVDPCPGFCLVSFIVVKCPFCWETYTVDLVQLSKEGPGHSCEAVVTCDFCEERARYLAAEFVDRVGIVGECFVCEGHVEGRTLLSIQPGAYTAGMPNDRGER